MSGARSVVRDIRSVERRAVPVRVAPGGANCALDDGDIGLSLIGDIYDASINPALWPMILSKIRDFIGGSAAAIFFKDASARSLSVRYQCGSIDPHYQRLYDDTYVQLDPSARAHALAEVGQPVSTGDVMSHDEFFQTRFYKEWARPQGLVDFVSAALDKSANGAAIFGVFRKREHGAVDDDTRWRIRRIAPHLRRAVMAGRMIEIKAMEAAAFADTLDGLNAGMYLVDSTGRVLHANTSGHALLSDASVLRAVGGRLAVTDADASLALSAFFAMAGSPDGAVEIKGIAVSLPGLNSDCYTAHALPLPSDASRRAGADLGAVAAVFVRKAVIDAPSSPEIIAKHYSLTPTELRVLHAIVHVGGVAETAQALGIGEATVKTHLHRVFGKTGSGRQADLVKLVAGFSNPLVT